MVEELLNAVTEPFTKVVCKLHESRIISIENFKIKKGRSNEVSLDTQHTTALIRQEKNRQQQVFLKYLLTKQGLMQRNLRKLLSTGCVTNILNLVIVWQ